MSTKIQARKQMHERSSHGPEVVRTSAVHSARGFLILVAALSTPVLMMAWESRESPSNIEAALADAPYVLSNAQIYCDFPDALERRCNVRMSGELFTQKLSMPVSADSFPSQYSVDLTESGAVRVKTMFKGEDLDLETAKSRLVREVNTTVATFLERRQEFEHRANAPAVSEEAKARNLATYP